MYNMILKQLEKKNEPIEVIVVGLGFMGFGLISLMRKLPWMRVPLVISRRPNEACSFLENHGFKVTIANNHSSIKDLASKGYVCVSDNLKVLKDYENNVVISTTGTIDYETRVALATLNAKKHLITMNVELQATLGTELKRLADQNGVIITDVLGDQPGSLARFIAKAKLMGFRPILGGNMKRFMNRHATQAMMKSWADDKGLSVRQVTSFTDGTKQSLEMTLLANFFGMKVTQRGMKGPALENIRDVLTAFDWNALPREGVVDYVIGRNLFPGIFMVAEHLDPHQTRYLRYLSLGDGPRYVLFEPYHLCHLEVPETIADVVLFGQGTINNGLNPKTKCIAVAKFNLQKDQLLDGIGGDCTYGTIDNIESNDNFLPMGFTDGAVVNRSIPQDRQLELSDVTLQENAATRLARLV